MEWAWYPPLMACFTLVVAAYLLGSIPWGLWIGRLRGIDVREQGSGNIGATNVGRALGKGWAVVVLVLDAAKGYLPVALATHAGCATGVVAVVMVAAVSGHVFSLYLRFRGGKGVATSLGVVAALCWPAALAGLLSYALALAFFRVSAVGSLLGVSVGMIVLVALRSPRPVVAAMGIVTLLIFWRHKENLRDLRRGGRS